MQKVYFDIEELINKIDDIDFSQYTIDYDTAIKILAQLYYTNKMPKDKFYGLLKSIEESQMIEDKEKLKLKHIIASIMLNYTQLL